MPLGESILQGLLGHHWSLVTNCFLVPYNPETVNHPLNTVHPSIHLCLQTYCSLPKILPPVELIFLYHFLQGLLQNVWQPFQKALSLQTLSEAPSLTGTNCAWKACLSCLGRFPQYLQASVCLSVKQGFMVRPSES